MCCVQNLFLEAKTLPLTEPSRMHCVRMHFDHFFLQMNENYINYIKKWSLSEYIPRKKRYAHKDPLSFVKSKKKMKNSISLDEPFSPQNTLC